MGINSCHVSYIMTATSVTHLIPPFVNKVTEENITRHETHLSKLLFLYSKCSIHILTMNWYWFKHNICVYSSCIYLWLSHAWKNTSGADERRYKTHDRGNENSSKDEESRTKELQIKMGSYKKEERKCQKQSEVKTESKNRNTSRTVLILQHCWNQHQTKHLVQDSPLEKQWRERSHPYQRAQKKESCSKCTCFRSRKYM